MRGSGGGEWDGGFQVGRYGFQCCLDAKGILLSEPCGFISCSLTELILEMLKLAVQAGKLMWV